MIGFKQASYSGDLAIEFILKPSNALTGPPSGVMFKKIIDEKFSELTYDESPSWSTHEDDVAWKDSDEDFIRYFDYAFLVKRGFFWSLMNYLPISHNATKMMFERYFKERFPDKFFISVDEFDA